MARVPYLTVEELAPENRDLLKRPIALNRAMANSPGSARVWSALGNYIRYGSKLDPRLRELAILQVGWLARAPYEWSHHVKIGFDFGVSPDDVRALIDETDGRPTKLDALTKTVLLGAREMTTAGAMTEPTFATLQSVLGTEQLVDLVGTIAHYNAVVRVLATLQIDVEDEYAPYLAQFPLPA